MTPLAIERLPAQRRGRATGRKEADGRHIQRGSDMQRTGTAGDKQGGIGDHLGKAHQPLTRGVDIGMPPASEDPRRQLMGQHLFAGPSRDHAGAVRPLLLQSQQQLGILGRREVIGRAARAAVHH